MHQIRERDQSNSIRLPLVQRVLHGIDGGAAHMTDGDRLTVALRDGSDAGDLQVGSAISIMPTAPKEAWRFYMATLLKKAAL